MEEKGLGDLGQAGIERIRNKWGQQLGCLSNTPQPPPPPQQEFPESSPGCSSLSPLALPGSRGQEPPNYFQMWTQPRGHGGEGAER